MQEIIVILIGIAILVYIGWKIYVLFFAKRKPTNDRCAGCAGCAAMQRGEKEREKECEKECDK